jgi:D-serine deaminase-like pyridoxal phosphate-dependent protein
MTDQDLKQYESGLRESWQSVPGTPDSSLPKGDVLARKHDYAEYREIFRGRAMPFAFVDLDLLAQNISEVAKRAAGKRVRLASKSLRSVAILRRILAANPIFQGIMCYSVQEAAYLASQGFDDLLVGYPCWQEQDISTVALAISGGARITLMIDSLEHIERIEEIAGHQNARIPVCLEIDMSLDVPGLHFGVWRSPIRAVEQARPLIERLLQMSHVYLDGMMGYEAQIAGVGDNFSGQAVKNRMVRLLKRRSEDEIVERRATIVSLARSLGVQLRFVNGGGTGSIETTKQEAVVTEITVGSAFYGPALFDNYRDFRYEPAAAYAIEIVRQPRPGLYTCLGGGYIASGSVGKEKQPQPYLPRGAQLVPLEGAGEVQTPIRYDGPEGLAIGDPIFLRHSKAGELCERFTHLLLVSQGAVVDEVTTYRGDGRCFI